MLFLLTDMRYKYELEKLCRLYLPFEKFIFSDNTESLGQYDNYIFIDVKSLGSKKSPTVTLKIDGKTVTETTDKAVLQENFQETEKSLALALNSAFFKATGYRSPWGILTGVRPAKLIGRLVSKNNEKTATDYFKDTLLVSEKKTKLCIECYKSEKAIISRSEPDSFSLYISVPFCPSRCSYCSFVSHSVEQAKKLIPEYVELLCREISMTAGIADSCGLKLKTIYIGGGTPTTLSAEQLTKVMRTVSDNFDLSQAEEYTVEAGRPDTITEDKLLAIKSSGATRISINPQTMEDAVLQKIGRRHTVGQTVEAYNLARKLGFGNINMDLIAGLNGDTVEGFRRTVNRITELDPESVTVHSLSMKRASNLNKASAVFETEQGEKASEMVDYAYDKLSNAGIMPYYLYRQSKTVGNLENVGYAKPGFEGLYNVYIMDETHSILACGASAVTKLRQPDGNYIKRIFNLKYPYEYISRFDEIEPKKQGIIEFCDTYVKQKLK